MRRFVKTFFLQIIKLLSVIIGTGISLYLSLVAVHYLSSWTGHSITSSGGLQVISLFFGAIGFLSGVGVPFLIQYWGRFDGWLFLSEAMLMLFGLVVVAGGGFAGIFTGIKIASTIVHSDGTGFAMLFFLFLGGIFGIILGILLAATVKTLWKVWRGSEGKLRLNPPSFSPS